MVDSKLLPPLVNKPGATNWIEKAGKLPDLHTRIAKHLVSEQGYTEGRAIATAINQVRKVCATGRTFGGRTAVHADTRAEYCNAARQFEELRAKSKVKKLAERDQASLDDWNSLAEAAWLRMDLLEHAVGPELMERLIGKARTNYETLPGGRFPMPDKEHARLALQMLPKAKDLTDSERAKIRERAMKMLGMPDSKVMECDGLYELSRDVAISLALIEAVDRPRHRDGKWTNILSRVTKRTGGAQTCADCGSKVPPKAMCPSCGSDQMAEANYFQSSSGGKNGSSPKHKPTGSSSGSFNEDLHPRGAKGSASGGKFVAKGSTGSEVSAIQSRVGVKADGSFGYNTRAAVIAFQKRHGLKVDGVVGHQTLSALRGNNEASKVKAGSLTQSDVTHLKQAGDRAKKAHKNKSKPQRAGGGTLL